jgi:hypothetical protein
MAKRSKPKPKQPTPEASLGAAIVRHVRAQKRFVLAFFVGLAVALFAPIENWIPRVLAGWNVGGFLYLVLIAIKMARAEVEGIKREAGAILGRANASERAALIAYAAAFGQAFQLADDLLDAEGDAATLGKAVAKDAGQGKATLIALLGTGAAKARLAGLVAEAEQALAPFGERAAILIDAARFVAERRA